MSGNRIKVQLDSDHEPSHRISIPSNPVAAELHPKFYFDDSLVVIQIENTLFRVHKYQLIKSETFSDMFKMPNGQTEEPEEGASREYPIVLGGVKSSDFEALLEVLYASQFSNNTLKSEPEIIVPAFRLAHKWNFTDLQAHLLPLVKDALGCVDKIVLARELGIQEWLTPAHVELCQRPEPLTIEEGAKLGIFSTIMIFRLREQFRPSQSAVPNSGRTGMYCAACVGVSRYDYSSPVSCDQCGGSYRSRYRYITTPSNAAPPSSNSELESQVKKWIEGGCVPE